MLSRRGHSPMSPRKLASKREAAERDKAANASLQILTGDQILTTGCSPRFGQDFVGRIRTGLTRDFTRIRGHHRSRRTRMTAAAQETAAATRLFAIPRIDSRKGLCGRLPCLTTGLTIRCLGSFYATTRHPGRCQLLRAAAVRRHRLHLSRQQGQPDQCGIRDSTASVPHG